MLSFITVSEILYGGGGGTANSGGAGLGLCSAQLYSRLLGWAGGGSTLQEKQMWDGSIKLYCISFPASPTGDFLEPSLGPPHWRCGDLKLD